MRRWIAKQLRRAADWLEPRPTVVIVFGRDLIDESARQRAERASIAFAQAQRAANQEPN